MKSTTRFALLCVVLGATTLNGEFAAAQSAAEQSGVAQSGEAPAPRERRGLARRRPRPPGQAERPEKLSRKHREGNQSLSRSPEELARMREVAKQRMKEARERMLTMSPEEREQMRQKHRETRDSRREASAERLKMRWGTSLRNPEVQAELKLHAVRMAQLQRIKALAEDNDKPELLDRAIALLRKEQLRHGAVMAEIARPAALEPRRNGAERRGPPAPDKPPSQMPMPGQVTDQEEQP